MNKVPRNFPWRFSLLDELICKTIISHEKSLLKSGHGQDRTADIYHVNQAFDPVAKQLQQFNNVINFPGKCTGRQLQRYSGKCKGAANG